MPLPKVTAPPLQDDWQAKQIARQLQQYGVANTVANVYQPTMVTSGTTAQNFSAATLMNR